MAGEEGNQGTQQGAEGSQQQQASGQGSEGTQNQGGQQQQGTEGAQGGQQEGQQGGEQGGKQEGGQEGKGGKEGSGKSLLGGAKADGGKGEGGEGGEGEGKEGEQGGAPESYTVNVPEGMEVDQALLEGLTPTLQKHKISQEAFQEIADVYSKHLQSMQSEANKATVEEFDKTVEEWKSETKKDHGASLKEVLSYGARAIDELGSPRLREVLDDTHIGDHPEMVKFFGRVGKMLSEDNFVDPETNSPADGGVDLGKMYDKDKK